MLIVLTTTLMTIMLMMTRMMLGVWKAGCLCAGSRRGPCRSASTPLTATTTNPQAPYSASPPQVSTLHPIYSSGLVVAWNVAGLLITTTHSQTQAPPLLLCLDGRRGPATYTSFWQHWKAYIGELSWKGFWWTHLSEQSYNLIQLTKVEGVGWLPRGLI